MTWRLILLTFLIVSNKECNSFLKLKSFNPIQLKKIVSAYNNFIKYLQSSESFIDYTYLWDLICYPDDNLFTNGINMIILDLPQDDTTGNINIICR